MPSMKFCKEQGCALLVEKRTGLMKKYRTHVCKQTGKNPNLMKKCPVVADSDAA